MIRDAAELIGKPYLAGARGPSHYDCAGVVIYARPDLADEIDRLASSAATVAACVENADQALQWVRLPRLRENCVVAMSRHGRAFPHIGIYQRGRVIHAAQGVGVAGETPTRLARAGWRYLRAYDLEARQ